MPLVISVAALAAVAPPVPTPHVPKPAFASDEQPRPVQLAQAAPVQTATNWTTSTRASLGVAQWNVLRQSDRLPFASYSSFLTQYRGWPGEAAMRKTAERSIDPATTPAANVLYFFQQLPPTTATGQARYAFALYASGQVDAARAAAQQAWRMGSLPLPDEQRLVGLFSSSLQPADYDQHLDAMLWDRDVAGALRALAMASPARRAIYDARIALQTKTPDAAARVAQLGSSAYGEPGLLADWAVWLRDTSQNMTARNLLAQSHRLTVRPANVEKWYETLLSFARGAAADHQWTLAYQIASQVDDAYAPGTDVSLRPYGERDEYTSLVWLAGTTALNQLGRPADAAGMFVRYARGGQSTQVSSKGYYWAGRAAQAAGGIDEASGYFALAAAYPELFYGQLALERLGRTIPPPPAAQSLAIPTQLQREAFESKDLVQATRLLGQLGRWDDQSLFVRTLADQADTPGDRILATQLATQIGRPDLRVWLARSARNSGSPFYTREAYPQVTIPASRSSYWSLAHGIIRQESSFDRAAVSHAGARGLMQLMTGTARHVADKYSLSYDPGRLTRDPDYNVLLGTSYFAELMDYWGGSAPLAVASYNAGSANVRKWVAANGDPRLPGVDVVKWIEDIPFTETRGYVQRVLENAVIYDVLNPAQARTPAGTRLSFYLGKAGRPG
ncbi:MAG: lytic transglycosylase domain-containing protein [Sphingomonadales bacterium]